MEGICLNFSTVGHGLLTNTFFFHLSISPCATTNSRFSTPGARSLPLTPPGVLERPNAAISCPDGLAHALSEQNLRLQQIVYEHKVIIAVNVTELFGFITGVLSRFSGTRRSFTT